MPEISIIIPCYNVEKYLRKCLDSVLAQTFQDWEAICVDDGSPDNCGKILDEYAKTDHRFKVIHQKNQGLDSFYHYRVSPSGICYNKTEEASLKRDQDRIFAMNKIIAFVKERNFTKKEIKEVKKFIFYSVLDDKNTIKKHKIEIFWALGIKTFLRWKYYNKLKKKILKWRQYYI